jgi:hypothetical protein
MLLIYVRGVLAEVSIYAWWNQPSVGFVSSYGNKLAPAETQHEVPHFLIYFFLSGGLLVYRGGVLSEFSPSSLHRRRVRVYQAVSA